MGSNAGCGRLEPAGNHPELNCSKCLGQRCTCAQLSIYPPSSLLSAIAPSRNFRPSFFFNHHHSLLPACRLPPSTPKAQWPCSTTHALDGCNGSVKLLLSTIGGLDLSSSFFLPTFLGATASNSNGLDVTFHRLSTHVQIQAVGNTHRLPHQGHCAR